MPKKAPLPKNWLARPSWKPDILSARDRMIASKSPKPGTKKYLEHALMAAGFEFNLSPKEIKTTKSLIRHIPKAAPRNLELDSLVTSMRKEGFPVSAMQREESDPVQWVNETWDSIGLHPWWSSTGGGQRTLCLLGPTAERTEQASSVLIYDLWRTLGEAPESRLPVFRRVSLMSLMNPISLSSFMDGKGKDTDLLVVHGGFMSSELLHQTFAYLAGVESMFDGFIVYEAVCVETGQREIARTAYRNGFHNVLGV